MTLTTPVVATTVLTTRYAGVVALGALFVALVAMAYLHASPTGLSPLKSAVSQYGITEFRSGYRTQTLAVAAAAVALVVALGARFHGHARNAEVVLLVIVAAARVPIGWTPMDEPGGELTAVGRRHGLLAIVAFLSCTFAAARFVAMAHTIATWRNLAPLSAVLAAMMSASLVLMMVSRASAALRNYFGLIERVFYFAMFTWLGVVAVACVVQPH